jgi:MFS family permease
LVPQSLSAMGFRVFMPGILTWFGYRQVLLANTMALGSTIALFATVGEKTRVWVIVVQAVFFGFFSSFQYSAMNTLVYADVVESDTSMASTIASTMQQMSMSFGVAAASLTAALFIPDRFHSSGPQMIHGIHVAFLVLGALTILSSLVFRELRKEDGDNVSRHGAAGAG